MAEQNIVKRYRVFGLVDSLIYLGPLGALLLASLMFWKVLLVAAAWAWVASRYFGPRWKIKRSIAYYTAGGWAVVTNGAPVVDTAIAEHVWRAMRWWNASALIGEGGFIVVKVTNDGLVPPARAGMVGVLPPVDQRARGLTDGNNIAVVWEPKNNGRDFYALLRHEVGHAVLNATGYSGEHHAEMVRLKCPDY